MIFFILINEYTQSKKIFAERLQNPEKQEKSRTSKQHKKTAFLARRRKNSENAPVFMALNFSRPRFYFYATHPFQNSPVVHSNLRQSRELFSGEIHSHDFLLFSSEETQFVRGILE